MPNGKPSHATVTPWMAGCPLAVMPSVLPHSSKAGV
nr:MAG TPA: hypothetical protein [Caudoviricetes sp.]